MPNKNIIKTKHVDHVGQVKVSQMARAGVNTFDHFLNDILPYRIWFLMSK